MYLLAAHWAQKVILSGPAIDTSRVFAHKFRLAINVAHVQYLTCGNRLYIRRFYWLTSGRSTSMPFLPSWLATWSVSNKK